jgi:hypothetical protein
MIIHENLCKTAKSMNMHPPPTSGGVVWVLELISGWSWLELISVWSLFGLAQLDFVLVSSLLLVFGQNLVIFNIWLVFILHCSAEFCLHFIFIDLWLQFVFVSPLSAGFCLYCVLLGKPVTKSESPACSIRTMLLRQYVSFAQGLPHLQDYTKILRVHLKTCLSTTTH